MRQQRSPQRHGLPRHRPEEFADALVEVLVFAEIYESFELAARFEQQFAPALVARRERVCGSADGEAALLFGGGGERVAQGFDLGEVEAVIGEGAAGEFAGLGVADGLLKIRIRVFLGWRRGRRGLWLCRRGRGVRASLRP
jgi:hypothetical protein